MKLLLDQNLSFKIPALISDICPEAVHVATLGLEKASDDEIWRYAKQHQYTILTKDSDFNDKVAVEGPPPSVIWIRTGNSRTSVIESLLRKSFPLIRKYVDKHQIGIVELDH